MLRHWNTSFSIQFLSSPDYGISGTQHKSGGLLGQAAAFKVYQNREHGKSVNASGQTIFAVPFGMSAGCWTQ